MVINTNIAAQTSAGVLQESSKLLAKSLSRLSSGTKILSPEDDAAGLAVSMRFDARINRTQAATQNLGNATSFSQTQDGFLKKAGKALDRMSELAVLAQDITKTDGDRSLYNREFQTLNSYISDITTKDFNGVSLFGTTNRNVTSDGDGGSFQITAIRGNYLTPPSGPSPSTAIGDLVPGFTDGTVGFGDTDGLATHTFHSTDTLGDMVSWLDDAMKGNNLSGAVGGSASYDESTGKLSVNVDASFYVYEFGASNLLTGLGLGEIDNRSGSSTMTGSVTLTSPTPTPGAPDISTASGAASALTSVKSAINQLASDRATVGATIARLNYTTEQLGILKTNLSSANSRIKDVNVAEESSEYARYNILVQSGTAMLAQANTMPNSALRLLG